jgi:hypothetical protein
MIPKMSGVVWTHHGHSQKKLGGVLRPNQVDDSTTGTQPGHQANGLLQGECTGVRLDASQAQAVAHQELHGVRVSTTALELAHKAFAEAVGGAAPTPRVLPPPWSRPAPCHATGPLPEEPHLLDLEGLGSFSRNHRHSRSKALPFSRAVLLWSDSSRGRRLMTCQSNGRTVGIAMLLARPTTPPPISPHTTTPIRPNTPINKWVRR